MIFTGSPAGVGMARTARRVRHVHQAALGLIRPMTSASTSAEANPTLVALWAHVSLARGLITRRSLD